MQHHKRSGGNCKRQRSSSRCKLRQKQQQLI